MRSFFVLLIFIICHIHLHAQNEVYTIPFKINSNKHIIVQLYVNDSVTGNFLFDTGSKFSVFDSKFTQKAGLKINNTNTRIKINGIGDGGGDSIYIVENVKLRIGNKHFIAKKTGIVDMPPVPSEFKLDGIIGIDLFINKILDIDFDNKKITVYNTKNIDKSYKSIPVIAHIQHSANNTAFTQNKEYCLAINFDLDQNTQLSGYGYFDTGSRAPFTFYTHIALRINAFTIKNPFVELVYTGAFGKGKSVVCYSTVKSLKIGDNEFNNAIVRYSKDEKGSFNPVSNPKMKVARAGIIGMDLIIRFNWILDFKNQKFYAKPNTYFSEKGTIDADSIKFQNIAFNIDKSNTQIVRHIIKNQKELNNISAGDTVKTVTIQGSGAIIPFANLVDSALLYQNIPLSAVFIKNGEEVTKSFEINESAFYPNKN